MAYKKSKSYSGGKKADVYQIVTDRIIEKLKAGTVPWQRPWFVNGELPANLITKKVYRGVNLFLLSDQYASRYWLSYKQAMDLGGNVRKGEKSTLIVYWLVKEKETGETDDNGEPVTEKIFKLLYHNVFNLCQCENIPESKLPADAIVDTKGTPVQFDNKKAAAIYKNMPNRPKMHYINEGRAYYNRATDSVHIARKDLFKSEEEYYSTEYHELVHSTGHESRLGRKDLLNSQGFGSENYSREELTAEMGAAMLCGLVGIVDITIENNAAYIASWLKKLENDPKLVVQAGNRAHKAVDYITGTPA